MDIHITSIGTPGNAGQDIQKQLKALPPEVRDAWPATLAAVRDDVAKQLQQQGGDNVQVDLRIAFDVKELTAQSVLRDFVSGHPIPGRPLTESERGILAGGGAAVPVPGESAPQRRRTSDASAAAAEPATPPK
jgi:hypothetical protein